jgi:DinB superfamily
MLDVDEIMTILRTTVGRLGELTADALPRELEPTGYGEEWSIAAVLAHLRACNDVLGGAMVRIVREDHPSWRAGNPRTWQVKSGYHDLPFGTNLDAFTTGRADLLAVLEPLPVTAWDRTATVAVPPGKTYERSVQYYGDWLAQHEGTHVKDLARRQAARRG